MQADAHFRMLPGDINNLYVQCSSANGEFFSAFSSSHWVLWFTSPGTLQRDAIYGILGESAPGKSTGEAMVMMESLAAKLPSGIGLTGQECHFRNGFRVTGTCAVRHITDCGVPVHSAPL